MAGAPALIKQLSGHTSTINQVILVPRDTALISVSDDRTIRVWIKRDNGDYWPSICQTLEFPVTCLALEDLHLFVGTESGSINHYKITPDLNRITLLRIYNSHQSRVSGLVYTSTNDWLMSIGRDKAFHWYTADTGRRLGSFNADGWCLCIAYDVLSQHVFVGDYGGSIYMLKLEVGENFRLVTTLKGHAGSVRSLHWDDDGQRLLSCSADKTVYVWEIGAGEGTALELNAHRARVVSLMYSSLAKKIFSIGDDKKMIVWNLNAGRKQIPLWEEANECQLCKTPFFWNIQKMWNEGSMNFKRQHHCRKCGLAVCNACSPVQSILPYYGYEYPVRMCRNCYNDLPESELQSSTSQHNVLITPLTSHLDDEKKLIAVGCSDHIIRLYDVASMM